MKTIVLINNSGCFKSLNYEFIHLQNVSQTFKVINKEIWDLHSSFLILNNFWDFSGVIFFCLYVFIIILVVKKNYPYLPHYHSPNKKFCISIFLHVFICFLWYNFLAYIFLNIIEDVENLPYFSKLSKTIK